MMFSVKWLDLFKFALCPTSRRERLSLIVVAKAVFSDEGEKDGVDVFWAVE